MACGVILHTTDTFCFSKRKVEIVEVKARFFCTLSYKNTQEKRHTPLDPQPNPDDIVKVHRLYQKLQEPTNDQKIPGTDNMD